MAIVVINCGSKPCPPCPGFPGFLNPSNAYKTYTYYDLDNCHPNGIVSATFNNNGIPIVTQSTEDYATIVPVGSQWYGFGSWQHIDSDTYSWFLSTPDCGSIRIYSILSNKL